MNAIPNFQVERSRAAKPLFYSAPAPDGCDPLPYQHAGVEYRLGREHALFGDAPGLGKTIECILTSNAIGAQRTLVVCPASLRLNWAREIYRWSTIDGVDVYPVLKASDGISLEHHYVVISYALLTNRALVEALLDGFWDHLILDEAHALKDPKGNTRTRIICAPDMLPSVVGNITMASGTILPNQPIECYNACRLLDWDCIDRMSLDRFRDYYYAEGGGYVRSPRLVKLEDGSTVMRSEVHWSNTVRNIPINLADLQDRLRSNIMVRRLKEHVLPQLPPKRWHIFPVETNSAIRNALKHPGWEGVQKLYDMSPDDFASNIPIDGPVASARRELGEAKAKVVLAYIEELLEEGIEKLVVGAWHISVLNMARERLEKYGLVYMDGSTSSKRKQDAVDQFQGLPEIRIILGQMMPLGEGWTLTEASDVVFMEPDWVPGKNEQLLDRVHRIGQTASSVIGHIPVVAGTLDERILSTVARKDRAIHQALDKEYIHA